MKYFRETKPVIVIKPFSLNSVFNSLINLYELDRGFPVKDATSSTFKKILLSTFNPPRYKFLTLISFKSASLTR